MSDNLQEKTFLGLIWGFLEKFSLQGFAFVQGIFLARWLTPADFGLVAMVGIFNSLSRVLIDSGFSTSLIRKKNAQAIDYSTVYDINIVMSFALCVVLCLCSSLIASFYNEPILSQIVCLNALQMFLGSFLGIYWVRMTIQLQFKKLSVISICSSLSSGTLSLVMAYMGYGVWSLVYPSFLSLFVNGVLYWYFLHWFPGHKFSKKSFKDLFAFGSNVLFSSLLSVFFNNIYSIVIGKKYSKQDLGYYSRGGSFANLPSNTITGVLTSVTYPILSKVQDDRQRLENVYRQMIRLSAYIVFPIMMGLAALARPVILFFVTEKWEPAIPYLQALCFSSMWLPIHALNLNMLKVKGRSDLFLRLEIIKKILIVVVLVVSLPFGVFYMCIGQIVTSYLCLIINTYYTGKLINVGFIAQMKDVLPLFVFSVSMSIVVYLSVLSLKSDFYKIIVGVMIGIMYYFIMSHFLHIRELAYLKKLVYNNLFSRK